MSTRYRSIHALDAPESVGRSERLAGWVQRRRDMGGIVFVDLRDSSGLVQVVLDPAAIPAASRLKMEDCIAVTGVVHPRPEGTVNLNLPTGEVEVQADDLVVLSPAETLPFMIEDRVELDERIRLKYRYLDLRRPSMAANLRARSKAVAVMRRVMDELDRHPRFGPVERPILHHTVERRAFDARRTPRT